MIICRPVLSFSSNRLVEFGLSSSFDTSEHLGETCFLETSVELVESGEVVTSGKIETSGEIKICELSSEIIVESAGFGSLKSWNGPPNPCEGRSHFGFPDKLDTSV